MSDRLTAEQVARNFEATGMAFELLGLHGQAGIYVDAARFVREHLGECDEERELLDEIAACVPELDDARLRYVTIQVPRVTWEQIQKRNEGV